MASARAMQVGLAMPRLRPATGSASVTGNVLIGTVKRDLRDIGKTWWG